MTVQQTEADQFLRDRGAAGGLIEFARESCDVNAAVLREVLTAEPSAGALPLTLSGARILGDLDLTGVTIKRGVTFRDCKFDRIGLEDSVVRSLRFKGGECRGIWGNRARIKGELALGGGFNSWGPVAFDEGHVEGSVFLNGGKFWPGTAENAGPKVLSFERTRIEQALVFEDEFSASGNVRLYHASIGANVEIANASILGRQPETKRPETSMVGYWGLDLEGAEVAGSILIGKKAMITGGLNLRGATIGTFELFGGASVQEHAESGVALQADYATFERTLDIGDSATVIGGIELRHAHAGVLTLRDYLAWPEGRVVLDGLTYDRYASSAKLLETDPVQWLERQRPDQLDPFRPQPWEQCAATLRAMGDDEEARRVQIEKERAWRAARRRRLRFWQRGGVAAYDTILDWTIRFGYRPARAGLWLLAFLLVGWACFAYVAPAGPGAEAKAVELVPASEHPPVFQPLVFAVDSFVPVLGLGMADAWRPSDAPEASWLRWFVWIYKLLGWALAGFWIAGFTGLVKK